MSKIITKKIPVTTANIVLFDRENLELREESFFMIGKLSVKKLEKEAKSRTPNNFMFLQIKDYEVNDRECSLTMEEFFNFSLISVTNPLMKEEVENAETTVSSEEE